MRAHTWIVLPTYNERQNLQPMLERLREFVPSAHVLVVDDASPDGTGELADALAAADPRVQVLHRKGKEGLGAAYRAAFSHLLREQCDAIVQMDCDFSHDPADVPRLLRELDAGADLVIGSRYVPGGEIPGWSLGRRMISRVGGSFARTVLGLPVRDLTGGFKAWRGDLLGAIDLGAVEAQGYGFQIEMTWRADQLGGRITEVPIRFGERRAGQSKMSRRIIAEALVMVLRLRARSMPLGGRASAGLLVRHPVRVGPVRRARREPIDHLPPTSLPRFELPTSGGVAAREAREPE